MNILISWWVIPFALSLYCLYEMFRPYKRSGDWDFGDIFRVLWVIPILIIWLVYFIIF